VRIIGIVERLQTPFYGVSGVSTLMRRIPPSRRIDPSTTSPTTWSGASRVSAIPSSSRRRDTAASMANASSKQEFERRAYRRLPRRSWFGGPAERRVHRVVGDYGVRHHRPDELLGVAASPQIGIRARSAPHAGNPALLPDGEFPDCTAGAVAGVAFAIASIFGCAQLRSGAHGQQPRLHRPLIMMDWPAGGTVPGAACGFDSAGIGDTGR